MSVGVGWAKLRNALETVAAHWEETKLRWDDAVRQDFEENYWDPVTPTVQSAMRAMDRLGHVLARARQECG